MSLSQNISPSFEPAQVGYDMHTDLLSILLSAEKIQQIINNLAVKIDSDYDKSSPLVLIIILKGASLFGCDLMRALGILNRQIHLEFMSVSSYGDQTHSSGNVKINMDIKTDIRNKNVIVVEDIVDTGLTMSTLIDLLKSRIPQSIQVCTFIKKPEQKSFLDIKYIGYEMKTDEFIVGYGMDYAEKYRELSYVAIANPALLLK